MRTHHLGLAAAFVVLTGCGGQEPTTSTVSGTIHQESFPKALTRLTVVDDKAVSKKVSVAGTGAFSVTLEEGAKYRFFLGEDGKSTPIVTNYEDGRLETEIEIQSGGASADIGQVAYWPGLAKSDKRTVTGVPGSTTPPATGGACESGVIQGTGEPCATTLAGVLCEGHDHHGRNDDFGAHHDHHTAAMPKSSADPSTDASATDAAGIASRSVTALDCTCPGM